MSDGSSDPDAETVREAVERSRSGAPAAGAVVRDRFETDEVFQRIIVAADEEMATGTRELFFSALAAGFAITLTFLAYAAMTAHYPADPLVAALLYPIGFVYIILGGYQLYTENTLPPVALVLERLASIPALLGTWLVVLVGNFLGGALGALALAGTGVFEPGAAAAALELSTKWRSTAWLDLLLKGVFAGFVVAGVVWLDYAFRDSISRLVLVYVAFLVIPLADLYHIVVSFTELMYLVYLGEAALLAGLTGFVLPVLVGNTLGGIVLVTVVNYFQATERRLESAREAGPDRQLSLGEWVAGGAVGRTYVPADREQRRQGDR